VREEKLCRSCIPVMLSDEYEELFGARDLSLTDRSAKESTSPLRAPRRGLKSMRSNMGAEG
jgi:hypothetical protein